MITQIVEMEVDAPCIHYDDGGKCDKHRIVGEIDADDIFWAHAQEIVDGEWAADDGVVSYQRDSIAVPNLEYDPDVLAYFAGQGLTKPGDTRSYDEWIQLLKRIRWENRIDGKCEICYQDYPAHCVCPSDVDCPNCQAGSVCIFH